MAGRVIANDYYGLMWVGIAAASHVKSRNQETEKKSVDRIKKNYF